MIDRIYLENFRRLSKADILVRDGITVLTGLNGTGKSTIIEAVLFCLFGKPRSGTSKDSIPRSNRAEGEVAYTAVDFELHGRHYRCRRYMTKKMSVMATLYAYDDDEYGKLLQQDDPRHLDKELGEQVASSATGVTSAITQLLGLGYDGYRASLVANQKELDSLSSLTPASRRSFLLDLTGYSRLDKALPEASKHSRESKAMAEGLERQAIDADAVRRQLKEVRTNLKVVNARVEKGIETTDRVQADLDAETERYNDLSREADELSRVTKQADDDDAELTRTRSTIESLMSQIAGNEETAKGYDEDSTITDRLADARVRRERASAYARTKGERDRIEATLADKERKVSETEARVSALRERLSGDEPNLDAANAALESVRTRQSANATQARQATQAADRIRRLLDDAESGRAAKCPTCGTPISTEGGREHLRGEIAENEAEKARLEGEAAKLRGEEASARAAVDATKARIRTWQSDSRDLGVATKQLELLRAGLDADRQESTKKSAFLTEHASDAMDQAAMLKLDSDIAALERQQTREAEMKRAFYAARDGRTRLGVLRETAAKLEASVKEGRAYAKRHAPVTRTFDACREKRTALAQKVGMYRQKVEELRRQQGADEASAKALEQQLETARKQREDMRNVRDQIEVWNAAREVLAYLRDSLPAKITPRLSEEASRLLDIATSGTYNLVEIDDDYNVITYTEGGPRELSLMSGGEQDVISLCIRIAIAEMILDTTGNGKQTMILDEIFGALDDSRKRTACDALQNLKSTLPRIVCVTHIEEIKDMADWTYVVEQDENGVSTVREVAGGDAKVDADGNVVTEPQMGAPTAA